MLLMRELKVKNLSANQIEDHKPIPYFRPILLFTEEECKSIEWEKYSKFYSEREQEIKEHNERILYETLKKKYEGS